MTEYSPHTETPQKSKKTADMPKSVKITLVSIAGVIGLSLSFLGGIQFQKGKNTTSNNTASAQSSQYGTMNGQMVGPGGRMRGNIGEVTAVSSTNITYTSRSGENKTFTINSDTKITSDGATATTGDIKVGDTVLVTENTSDTSIAARIAINPTMGNAPTDTQVNTN